MQKTKLTILKELQVIPGVGPAMAQDLYDLGIFRVSDLRAADPEQMYRQTCALAGTHVDRCVLYVYRCAVYFAQTQNHDPELLKWWNWKNTASARRRYPFS